jgi:hypothetical protein
MAMEMKASAALIASVTLLAACRQPIGEYATNAEQCKGAYDDVRSQFRRKTAGQIGPGTGLAKAIVRGQQESAYQDCLARVGATPAQISRAAPLAYTGRQRGAALLSGGAGYRGSYLYGGAGSGPALAAAPQAPVKAPPTPKGKLPLPVEYPLLPGDAELWPTLTLEQQKRALLFLKDGSTIRASLRTD